MVNSILDSLALNTNNYGEFWLLQSILNDFDIFFTTTKVTLLHCYAKKFRCYPKSTHQFVPITLALLPR
jgi:hypothetical protein